MNNKIFISGVKFDFLNYNQITKNILQDIKKVKSYICFPDSYVLSLAQEDSLLRDLLNSSYLTLPDGKPIALLAKIKGLRNIDTVSGYVLAKHLFNTELKHFIYGSSEEVCQLAIKNIKKDFPSVEILGFKSPPFLPYDKISNNDKISSDFEFINSLKPDIVWLGISSPKQDFVMGNYVNKLNKGIIIGVGAVINYFAYPDELSPDWMKKYYLRWLYRLIKNPKRLFKKYLFTFRNLIFLFYKELFHL